MAFNTFPAQADEHEMVVPRTQYELSMAILQRALGGAVGIEAPVSIEPTFAQTIAQGYQPVGILARIHADLNGR